MATAATSLRVDEGCALGFGGWTVKWVAVLLMFSSQYFEAAIALSVAAGVGAWYFQDDPAAPPYPAFKAMGWAFSTSAGACTQAALLTALVEKARELSSKAWRKVCCDPFALFVMVVWCALREFVGAISRFTLIAHAFFDGGLRARAGETAVLVRRRVGAALATDTVASVVLSSGSYGIAIAVGFGTLVLVDFTENLGIMRTIAQGGGGFWWSQYAIAG